MVVKGNGVEETPFRFGAPAIGSIRDGVGQIQQRGCGRPVMGIGTKSKQSTSTPTMMGDVGMDRKIVERLCYDGRGQHGMRSRGAAAL